jgi:2'-5' RNA ligase
VTTRRLFFALWPDAAVRTGLIRWARAVHGLCGGRMMRPDTLHLTLAFLGAVETGRIPDLQALLQRQDWPAGSLCLDCHGRFRGPRIVWAGPRARVPWLEALHEALWRALQEQGFERPGEPFRPHVSLLRGAGPGDLATLPAPGPVHWTPHRLVLVASRPQETGSYYETLAETAL